MNYNKIDRGGMTVTVIVMVCIKDSSQRKQKKKETGEGGREKEGSTEPQRPVVLNLRLRGRQDGVSDEINPGD